MGPVGQPAWIHVEAAISAAAILRTPGETSSKHHNHKLFHQHGMQKDDFLVVKKKLCQILHQTLELTKNIKNIYIYLASWELLQEGCLFIGLAKDEVRCNLNINAGILGSNKSLVCAEIIRVCVQCLKKTLFHLAQFDDGPSICNGFKLIACTIYMMIADYPREKILTPAIFTFVRREKRV